MDSHLYNTESTLTQLVRELVSDVKQLLRQELALAKYEFHEEVGKTKVAFVSLGIGVAIAAIGSLLLIAMLVHLLNALAELPLWTCYGIVGGVCAIAGMVLVYRGIHQVSQIEMIPQQTVESLKENARWIKEKAISEKI